MISWHSQAASSSFREQHFAFFAWQVEQDLVINMVSVAIRTYFATLYLYTFYTLTKYL